MDGWCFGLVTEANKLAASSRMLLQPTLPPPIFWMAVICLLIY